MIWTLFWPSETVQTAIETLNGRPKRQRSSISKAAPRQTPPGCVSLEPNRAYSGREVLLILSSVWFFLFLFIYSGRGDGNQKLVLALRETLKKD